MHHLSEHINQDIARRWRKDKDSTVKKKLNTGAKEIQQVNPGGLDKQPKYQAPTISSIDKSLSRNRHRVWSPTHQANLIGTSMQLSCFCLYVYINRSTTMYSKERLHGVSMEIVCRCYLSLVITNIDTPIPALDIWYNPYTVNVIKWQHFSIRLFYCYSDERMFVYPEPYHISNSRVPYQSAAWTVWSWFTLRE